MRKTKTGYSTFHITVSNEDAALFRRVMEQSRCTSYAQAFVQAVRALEEKEAKRLKDLAKLQGK